MSGTAGIDDAAGERARTPEQLRSDLGELRAELGDTVEELANRADVPARVRARREETTERVQQQLAHLQNVVAQRAPAVEKAVRDQPAVVGGAALVLSFLLVTALRRRKRSGRS